ncbi:hypothetical protein [Pseudoduganella chitinolytica]|uniref:Secreted protein n=1 Tax=Pseudoduganella chitinolytica TaxID=34070 RepID=A0ABY8BDW5_9BURK|nr:hypothetical protein [Pseudoduganella chitinolytica]WEF34095.1 hypothetical protein PX653_04800 [Pseudoduganella chitinolytica]
MDALSVVVEMLLIRFAVTGLPSPLPRTSNAGSTLVPMPRAVILPLADAGSTPPGHPTVPVGVTNGAAILERRRRSGPARSRLSKCESKIRLANAGGAIKLSVGLNGVGSNVCPCSTDRARPIRGRPIYRVRSNRIARARPGRRWVPPTGTFFCIKAVSVRSSAGPFHKRM